MLEKHLPKPQQHHAHTRNQQRHCHACEQFKCNATYGISAGQPVHAACLVLHYQQEADRPKKKLDDSARPQKFLGVQGTFKDKREWTPADS